jgi:hypothetical protein
MEHTKKQPDLKAMASLAKRRGYTVEIKHDHIVARNDTGCIRTASMDTLKKVAAA